MDSEFQEFSNFVRLVTSASPRPWRADLHEDQVIIVMPGPGPGGDQVMTRIPLGVDLDRAKVEIVRMFRGNP